MKIAIQANPSRGKEIISLLESLGGSKTSLTGDGELYTYYIDSNTVIRYDDAPKDYKVYTLEEFEKEFPFKIGDVVVTATERIPRQIIAFEYYDDKLCYTLEDGFHYKPQLLELYKEMKEERNITLTLDKAKEWYNKGGELREIALQAFTENELKPLPRSWEEFCKKHPIKEGESYINSEGKILSFTTKTARRDWDHICPSKQSTEAHLALMQLEQLRDCWRQGWKPKMHESVYAIKFSNGGLKVYYFSSREFLSFQTKEMAEEFFECFRDLIEKAGDLI